MLEWDNYCLGNNNFYSLEELGLFGYNISVTFPIDCDGLFDATDMNTICFDQLNNIGKTCCKYCQNDLNAKVIESNSIKIKSSFFIFFLLHSIHFIKFL